MHDIYYGAAVPPKRKPIPMEHRSTASVTRICTAT